MIQSKNHSGELKAESDGQASPVHTLTQESKLHSFIMTGLFVLAVFYTLYFARALLIPIALAIVISLMLSPIMDVLQRLRIPAPLGAACLLGLCLAIVIAVGYWVSFPASQWMSDLPSSLRQLELRLRENLGSVERIREATERVAEAADGGAADTVKVEVKRPLFSSFMANRTRSVLVTGLVTTILVYFLLASGDLFLRKAIKVTDELAHKKRTVEIARQIQDGISSYILSISVINLGLGVVIAVAMHLLGLSNPILIGLMATILNFVPYAGALVGIGIVGIVGFIDTNSLSYAVLPMLIYWLITTLEAYIITPMVLGREFVINPVIIVLGLIFWGWLWGVTGAILSVPILVTTKIVCAQYARLRPVSEFLGK